ncbi:MAG: ACP S-malonyltransferase [Planctomycetes bacterium]|jgi:[acyl-carrier-protein] S-malonyltransferase|nr:ACP S-malonyltransferase [Planctomycetota bacterium]
MKTAFLFPGQGSQYVGMGVEVARESPAARAVFERADDALGIRISRICAEGPEEVLQRTDVSQPAILVTSLATYAHFQQRFGDVDGACHAAAGLSLGEYTAWAAAGAIEFENVLRLVRRRGELMQKACEMAPSGMASIIGLDRGAVEACCTEASGRGLVSVCNLNGPDQIAIGGEMPALHVAMEIAKTRGAKRVIPLKVAGGFHTRLMKPAEEELAEELRTTPISKPRFPVVANLKADYVNEPEEIRDCLIRQLTNPVLWSDSMNLLLKDGVSRFFEIGPGNVLSGLMRRLSSAAECVHAGPIGK